MKYKRYIISLSFLVAILNIFDGIVTNYGLKEQKIEELNPLMNQLWHISPSLFLLLKIILSILLVNLSIAVYRYSKKKFQQLYFSILSGLFVLYAAIFSLHIFWLALA